MGTIITALVMGLAAAVQGATGFGFGLVAIALLGNLLSIKTASAVLALASLSMNAMIFWRLRSHFRWEGMAPVLFGVVVGAPLGVLFLARAEARILAPVLGGVLVASAVYGLVPKLAVKPWHPLFLGLPLGVLSGALSGAFGTGGPPLVAFLASRNLPRLRYSASLQVALGASGVIRIAELLRRGLLTKELALQSASGVVFTLAGAWVGLRVLHGMSDRVARRTVSALLLILGLRYLATL